MPVSPTPTEILWLIGVSTGVVLLIIGFFIATVIVNQRRYITAQQEKLAESKRVEELLREIPQRIVHAQEEERSRVARDLHDGINQMLASIRYRLHTLTLQQQEKLFVPLNVNSISEVVSDLERTMDEVKRLSHNLHPKLFDDLGFIPAVRELCEEFSNRTNIRVYCNLESISPDLPKQVGLALFRISQEALRNIEQHAHAKNVSIESFRDAAGGTLTICDDGKGFNGSVVHGRGLGLKTMKERAALIGGSLDIQPMPNKGTTITVRFPVSNQDEQR